MHAAMMKAMPQNKKERFMIVPGLVLKYNHGDRTGGAIPYPSSDSQACISKEISATAQ
jgi:hypothetical protein